MRFQGEKSPANAMLNWTLMFLGIALIAAILGFGLMVGAAAIIAKVLFVAFLLVWIASLISGRRTV
jgi:uncharacterized membrane protein YtjA (UPF0391 family)